MDFEMNNDVSIRGVGADNFLKQAKAAAEKQLAKAHSDDDRPHGEHPSMGRCDCDLCQRWDMEHRK